MFLGNESFVCFIRRPLSLDSLWHEFPDIVMAEVVHPEEWRHVHDVLVFSTDGEISDASFLGNGGDSKKSFHRRAY
jgi:hypothetical protein